jgi:HEAT repeat protein
LIFAGLLVAMLPAARGADADPVLADELVLQYAGLSTDGPALVEFLRKHAQEQIDANQLQRLVQELGASEVTVREKAIGQIVTAGPLVIPALRQAASDPDDRERAANAHRCLQALEGDGGVATLAAAVRLVAQRKPPHAVEALLQFIPLAPDDGLIEQIRSALASLAYGDQTPNPELIDGLGDALALRRAVAAEALCQGNGPVPLAAVRKLLQDKQPLVRLRVALMLADRKEVAAIDTLIQLLKDLPIQQAKPAEEYLFSLAGETAPKTLLGDTDVSADKCRDAWAAWWRRSEGPSLLDEFRKRGITEKTWAKTQQAIKNLSDDLFEVREKATDDLMEMGSAVVPLLRQAAASGDPEVSQRAQKCLDKVGPANYVPLPTLTARLVAYRKPSGAAEALLTFLPFAEDAAMAEEVRAALIDVTFRDGHADPAVVKALEDQNASRRAAAAEALVWGGAAERKRVLLLLHDADAEVRGRAALALAGRQNKEAVPVLIDLLANASRDQAAQVENFLRTVKGPRVPQVSLGNSPTERRACRDAWANWWRGNEPHVEMVAAVRPAAPRKTLGYILVVMPDSGQIQELGLDRKVRWQLTGFPSVSDAQALPGDRILVAETNFNRVTERNQKSEILWQKEVNFPTGCQRLANGHTFIVCRNQLLEVDRAGKEILTIAHRLHDILAARKLPNGHIICLTNRGLCQHLDAGGKEIKSFNVAGAASNAFDALPNGHVLLTQQWANKVLEFNAEGKQIWETTVQQPTSALRLPNGNTLVTSQWPAKVLEIDHTGKTVWDYDPPSRPARLQRR